MPASLEPGVKVSRYSIVGPIGAGGMGEVYKAQDASLERMVALKILPPDVVRNDERRRRFVQEARSASSLNHPHIVTIHEIGEATLESSGQAIHYIAMELIDGVTLKQKIHQEGTDLRTLLTYLAQAAEGLAKAHTAGIVHRDLKPENIMVTRDGFAKVLDFGLAKLSVRKAASETMDATVAREETREGTVLGTVAYMAPEQVMGKVVDHRCDVFSFGAILYEAATRRRPFEADSDVDVMHKILHDAPEPVDRIDATVPAEVRRLIRRCLAKDPERRFQSMKDLSIDLREIVETWDELSTSATSQGSGSQTASGTVMVQKRGPALWIAIAVAAAALATLAWLGLRNRDSAKVAPAAAPAATLQIQRLTSSSNVGRAAMSRDGRYIAYVVRDLEGRNSLRVRQVATASEVEVAPVGTEIFVGVAFSWDGNYVYYARREPGESTTGWLYQVPALGGPSRKILHDVDTGPAFSPDGRRLAFGRGVPQRGENHYVVANVDGTGVRVAAAFPRFSQNVLCAPAWSPDGTKLMAARLLPPGGASATPVEIDLSTGAHRDLGAPHWWWISSVVYTADARGLLMTGFRKSAREGQLWVQPLPEGEPRRLTNDFSRYSDLSLAADGKSLSARSAETDGEIHVASIDDPNGGSPVENERSRGVAAVVTAASGAIVYGRGQDADSEVTILDGPAAQPRLLTSKAVASEPSVTADGKKIVYTSYRGDPSHLWVVDGEGGPPRQITNGDGERAGRISPDGKTLLYVESEVLWKRAFAGGEPARVIDRPTGSCGFSSDSRLMFFRYWGATEATLRMRVEPVAGGAPLLDLPSRGGRAFRFSPAHDGITYTLMRGGVDQIFKQPLSGGEPVQMTKFRRGAIESFDWTADGKLVYIRPETRSDVVLFTGF